MQPDDEEGRPGKGDPHNQRSADIVQPSTDAFDRNRYSPTTVAVLQRLPQGGPRAFAIASALGSYRDGVSTGRIRSGTDIVGVLITPRRLPVILDAIGIGERQWRHHVEDWENRYLAHGCWRGTVFLFAKPVLTDCPNCHERLVIDHVPPSWKRPKQTPRGFIKDRTTTEETAQTRPDETAQTRPESGANTSVAPAQTLPLSERKSDARAPLFLQGVAVKVPPGSKGSKDGLRGEGEGWGRGDPSTGGEVPPTVPNVVDLPSRRASKFGATVENATVPCPGCGAKRADVGYRGHGSNCPRFYRAT